MCMCVNMCLIHTYRNYMMVMHCVFIQQGWNALHCAACGGHAKIFRFLINHHPDLLTGTDNVSDDI